MKAHVLVDTSAWIEFYHPQGPPEVKKLLTEALELHDVAVVAPVVVELLSGAPTRKTYQTLRADLDGLTSLPWGHGEAQAAGALGWELARGGRRVPTTDVLIAAAAHATDTRSGTSETGTSRRSLPLGGPLSATSGSARGESRRR